jgi:hypothetical protein
MAVINPAIPSGPYTATWNGNGIGLFEGLLRMQQTPFGLPVRASQWGQAVIDYIMQSGGYFGVAVVKEWTTATKAFMWPFGADMGVINEPGLLFSSFCQPLVLTALAGTPAATYGPVTRTYTYAATLPGHNLDVAFGPAERNVVVAVGVLPQPNAGGSYKARFFTDT